MKCVCVNEMPQLDDFGLSIFLIFLFRNHLQFIDYP